MRRFIASVLCMLSITPVVSAELEVAFFDELAPLYPDSTVGDGVASIELDAPRGVPIGVHLLATGLDAGTPMRLSATSDARLPVAWSRLIAVPVEENTGLDSRTEQFKGDVNPHVIRRAPFETYEVVEPIAGTLTPDGHVVALRLELSIPADATSGESTWSITVEQG